MRVLVSSTSGYGHVFPMLPLARAFGAAGHDVLWATGAHAAPLVAAANIETAACGLTGVALERRRHEVLSAAGVEPAKRAAFVFPRMFGEAMTPPMVADLLPVARDWHPDLMVHEHAELASPLVGAAVGAPSVTHAFGGAVPAAFVAEAGDRVASSWRDLGIPQPSYAGCFESVYLDICPPSVQSVPMDHIHDVQPLRPVADTGAGPLTGAPAPGDEGAPLVYVTMGTVQNRALPLGPIVAALATLPVRVLVAVGRDVDPAALGSQPEHVRVERWVNQPQVLRECSVVVSHGGSGTFLGALAQGLPQLCLPQAADQFRNAEGGTRAGASLTLLPGEASPESVAGAVSRLLTDQATRRAAAGVAAEIAAMPSPERVVDVLVGRYGSA